MKIDYVVLDENLRFEDVREYAALLPVDRQQKIERYHFDKDKLLSLAAGLLIHRTVGESPILYGEHGKPYAENGVFFSVSHSGNIAAIAADDHEIGLDVELIPDESRLRVADRFFHNNERAYVSGADDKRRAFCEIWTRKEAYLKMTGEGISTDLTAFDTTEKPLKDQIMTVMIGEMCLSVCSGSPMEKDNIYISKFELKVLLP